MNLNNVFYELLIKFEIPDFYAKLINLFLVGLIIILVVKWKKNKTSFIN